MRISKIKVDEYGPLKDIVLEPSEGFQLYFGENESGKTLLVDAIIKMMIGDNDGRFPQLSRVNELPDGSLVLETDDGEKIVLPRDGFEKVADSVEFGDFSVEDLRNAFIIRDVDLRRPNKKDFGRKDYFKRLIDCLIGVKTQRIKEIKEELRNYGYLTRASSKKAKLRNRQDDGHLRDKKEAAKELLENIKEYRRECKTEGVIKKFSEEKELEQKIKDAKEKLELLDKAKDRKKLEDSRNLVKDLEETQDKIKKHGEREKENEEYREIQSDIEDVIRRKESERLSPKHHKEGFIASAALFIASVIGTIFAPLLLLGFSIVFGCALGYFGWKLFGWYRLEKEDSNIVDRANRSGIEGSTLSKISAGVEDRLEKFEKKTDNLQVSKAEIIGNLRGKFGGQGKRLDYWKEEVENFAQGVDEEIEVEYDESEESDLKESLGGWEEKQEESMKILENHWRQIRDFDNEISKIRMHIPTDICPDLDEVKIRSIDDLRNAQKQLKSFIEELDNKVENARIAIGVLEDLEREEEREISELLDGDGYALNFFEDVTDGKYTDLRYDEDKGEVKVTRSNGEELTPNELSQSTYDLLYMAIRISLARKLMGDETGFQILDNPFLQSDSNRIRREMKLLKGLAEDGWNIIYFTYRDSVKETIENLFGDDIVEELPRFKFG